MLVQWALDRCEAEGCPAYVESTVEAVQFYENLGFKEAGRIAIDLSGLSDQRDVDIYQEAGCIYMPKGKSIS
jgi:predicted N-acetyltransferase YhbS